MVGYLHSVDWSTGMECWNGALEWSTGLECWTGVLEGMMSNGIRSYGTILLKYCLVRVSK
jgi:hypothetical protein